MDFPGRVFYTYLGPEGALMNSWCLTVVVLLFAAGLDGCSDDQKGGENNNNGNNNNANLNNNNVNTNNNNNTGPRCGNNLVEGTETCDGTDFAGETCATQGFDSGTLSCAEDCGSFVTTGCVGDQDCGNGIIEGNETCDGTNLDDENCFSMGYDGGWLACLADCTGFDFSGCWQNFLEIHV